MKILVLANYDEGLYKFRKELLEKLVINNEVFVCVPKGEYVNKLQEIGCSIIPVVLERRGTNPIKDLKLIKNYIDNISSVKPDVVLTYTIKPNVYGGIASRIKKVPYIANITGLGSTLENKSILQVVSVMLYKIGLKKAKKVFFQNKSNLEFMIKHKIVKNNYDLLPGSGVNLDHYKYIDYPKKDTYDFVYVGRIMKEKGFDQFADAAKEITQKYNNVFFHICGWYEDDYLEIVKELIKNKQIIYHGRVDDMNDIYKDMDCTILPTYYSEGLSNVLLESLACGRPIITTNRPGCKEVIDDGINGFVIEQQNSKDLIAKIEKFISMSYEERKQFGINGRNKVEKQFDRNIVVDKYIQEISTISN